MNFIPDFIISNAVKKEIHASDIKLKQIFPKGLSIGCKIIIMGNVDSQAELINFNFLTENDSQVLNIEADFSTNKVKRITNIDNKVHTEDYGQFPFVKSSDFELLIVLEETRFKIIVNRKIVYYYSYKTEVTNIKSLKIKGDVYIRKACVLEGLRDPAIELWNQIVPFVQKIPAKENTKYRVLIEVSPSAERFEINFQRGAELDPRRMCFHFNPRWNETEALVVMNHRLAQTWGFEVREKNSFPFRAGEIHEIVFDCVKDGWQIQVDRKHFQHFSHRMSYTDVDHICIKGSINLKLFEVYL